MIKKSNLKKRDLLRKANIQRKRHHFYSQTNSQSSSVRNTPNCKSIAIKKDGGSNFGALTSSSYYQKLAQSGFNKGSSVAA